MLATTKETKKANFDLARIKNAVEGKDSGVAVTLEGKMSPMEIMRALMNVNVDKLQNHS